MSGTNHGRAEALTCAFPSNLEAMVPGPRLTRVEAPPEKAEIPMSSGGSAPMVSQMNFEAQVKISEEVMKPFRDRLDLKLISTPSLRRRLVFRQRSFARSHFAMALSLRSRGVESFLPVMVERPGDEYLLQNRES